MRYALLFRLFSLLRRWQTLVYRVQIGLPIDPIPFESLQFECMQQPLSRFVQIQQKVDAAGFVPLDVRIDVQTIPGFGSRPFQLTKRLTPNAGPVQFRFFRGPRRLKTLYEHVCSMKQA